VNGYYAEIKHFVSCVLNDEKPLLDPYESCETLKITLAALESAKTGKPVEVGSS
jgi:predicted dehydrogenase